MRALIINDEVEQQLLKLKDYAESHPYTMDDILDVQNGEKKPPGDTKGHFIYVPVGYKVVFTIELQQHKVRHISVGVSREGKFPSPDAVNVLMRHLGFKNTLESGECKVWIEGNTAVNVAEKYD